MFQRLFAWLTGRRESNSTVAAASSTKRRQKKVKPTRSSGIVTINRDEISAEESSQIPELLAKDAGMELFTGRINHAYDATFAGTTDRCPRCDAPMRQQYANWVYATDHGLRAMTAPSGYFCTKCSTVIVDQSIIKEGVPRGFRYVNVLGLTDNANKGFQPLTTWNGQKPVYLFDEESNTAGLVTMDELSPEDRKLLKSQRKAQSKRWKVKRNR